MDDHKYEHNVVWITNIQQIHSGKSMIIIIMQFMNGYDHAESHNYNYDHAKDHSYHEQYENQSVNGHNHNTWTIYFYKNVTAQIQSTLLSPPNPSPRPPSEVM